VLLLLVCTEAHSILLLDPHAIPLMVLDVTLTSPETMEDCIQSTKKLLVPQWALFRCLMKPMVTSTVPREMPSITTTTLKDAVETVTLRK
jgi:hypothetical protein